MNDYNYDSYCGIYCGACDILMAHKTGHKSKFALFWSKKNIENFQKSQGVTSLGKDDFQLTCKGCKSSEVFINCKVCKMRTCAQTKGVAHCSNCEDFPCELYTFEKGKTLLPHLETASNNLETISNIGVENWLKEQEKEWACPNCQTSFSWYSTTCTTCDNDLKERTYKFTWIRSMLLKLGLYLYSRKQQNSK